MGLDISRESSDRKSGIALRRKTAMITWIYDLSDGLLRDLDVGASDLTECLAANARVAALPG